MIVHGQAREIDLEAPDGREFLDYFQEVYGDSWDYWHGERYRDRKGTGFNAWIQARQIFTLQPAPRTNAAR